MYLISPPLSPHFGPEQALVRSGGGHCQSPRESSFRPLSSAYPPIAPHAPLLIVVFYTHQIPHQNYCIMFRRLYLFGSQHGSRHGSRLARPRNLLPLAVSAATLVGTAAVTNPFSSPFFCDSPAAPLVDVQDLKSHNSLDNGIWIAINGHVYDVSDFLSQHPGGARIIMKYAGKDASHIFNKIHQNGVLEALLEPHNYVGPLLEPLEPDEEELKAQAQENIRLQKIKHLPSISRMFSINDFEYVAKQVLAPSAWAYYSGGADDEFTIRENHYAYHRIYFNPKVLNNTTIPLDMSTTMLGQTTAAPFYCSAAASAQLGHEDGELSIARGCGRENIIQMISSAPSYLFEEIVAAALPNQTQWFQLYVKPDRKHSFDMIKKCENHGIKGIFVTVDSSLLGRREKDYKLRYDNFNDEDMDLDPMKSFQDSGLNWNDIINFKKAANIPLVIKGVQRPEDVILAAKNGVDAVVLSNHGGRQLDFSRPPIEVLAETMPMLKQHNLQDKIEVYVDGGVKRGTDVVKALCLGAKGVGLGRPFLYANTAYGEKGIVRAIQILKSEIFITMKLLGAHKISDLTPELLDLRGLSSRRVHDDALYESVRDPLQPPEFTND